jgi:hypothetical protein
MLKIKSIKKALFSETMQTHETYYFSASPSSHEFRATSQSQIGPRGATLQPKQVTKPSLLTTKYGSVNCTSILRPPPTLQVIKVKSSLQQSELKSERAKA